MSEGSSPGDRMYALVEDYWSLGVHRSGTSVDHRTAAWMADRLGRRGLAVDPEEVPFDHFVVESQVECAGRDIDHLVVPYEWTGRLETDSVVVAEIDPKSGGFPGALDEPARAVAASGADVALLATAHPEGALVAVNRELGSEPCGLPLVLVAGREADTLGNGNVQVRIDAKVTSGHTTNIIARNPVPGTPLVLTTPLNGWFGCAGERGTGIAVLIELVDRLAHLPLLVVATGGHELGWFGAQRWVDANRSIDATAVVHIGASVAVLEPGTDPHRELASTRLAMTSLPDSPVTQTIAAALAPARLDLATGTDHWLGEGQAFCLLDAPLLSFTGAGLDFHCPEDTPERATSPDALAKVADAIGAAALELDRAHRHVR